MGARFWGFQIFTGLQCVSILNTTGEKRHVRRLPRGRTRERLVGCRARARFYDTGRVCNSGGVQRILSRLCGARATGNLVPVQKYVVHEFFIIVCALLNTQVQECKFFRFPWGKVLGVSGFRGRGGVVQNQHFRGKMAKNDLSRESNFGHFRIS